MIGKALFVVVQLIQFPFVLGLFLYTNLFVDKSANEWVISGHRGRIKADNSAALFNYISRHTRQPIVWIIERNRSAHATDDEAVTVAKHTLRARMLIARAPVLIYSHGEDDLDCLMFLLRGFLGKRVYISHGSNVVKRSVIHPENLARQGFLRRFAVRWLATDYDVMLCYSEEEKRCADANRPQLTERHIVSIGPPRMDAVLPLTKLGSTRRIVYIPTFRDTSAGNRQLLLNLQALTKSEKLAGWLEREEFQLTVVCHINTTMTAVTLPASTTWVLFKGADRLWEQLSTASCLVTDYSSILIDWLLFDRPAVFFPFDLDDFLLTRGLHQPYGQYVYGDVVNGFGELEDVLTSGQWMDNPKKKARRRELRTRFFPVVNKRNAQPTYEAICKLTGSSQKTVTVSIGIGQAFGSTEPADRS